MHRLITKGIHNKHEEENDKQLVRISFFGGSRVGKTELIHRFLADQDDALKIVTDKKKHHNNNKHKSGFLRSGIHASEPFSFRPYIPTVEDFYVVSFHHSPRISIGLEIVDTSGGEQFPAMRRLNIQHSSVVVIMYDVTKDSTMREAIRLYQFTRDARPPEQDQMIIFLGGKSDLVKSGRSNETPLDQPRNNALFKDALLDGDFNVRSLVCSAKTGYNIRNVFEIALEQQIRNIQLLEHRPSTLSLHLGTPSSSRKEKEQRNKSSEKEKKKKRVHFHFPRRGNSSTNDEQNNDG